MIKILHIVHALTRGGGLSNFVMNYYRIIDRTKIQFDFFYFKEVENDFKDEITALGGSYYCMVEPSLSLTFLKEKEAFFNTHKGEYAAIHCHALFATAIYGRTAKKHGIKYVIAHSHSSSCGEGFIRRLRNHFFIKSAKHTATHYMACSEDAAVFMFGKKELQKGNVIIINNAIECDKYIYNEDARNKTRDELNLGDSFVVGHVGGFAKQKNHEFLIDTFHEICKFKSDSILLLVGGDGIASGSTKKVIEEKVKHLGLEDRVKFLGIRRDVNRLMCAMDAFIFPSTFEGFGLVLVEAQAAGLPSFASENVPCTAKVTDLVNYLPLSAGSAEWAEAIIDYDYGNKSRVMDLSIFDMFNIEKKKQILENIYLGMK